jgi:hypothetical protein
MIIHDLMTLTEKKMKILMFVIHIFDVTVNRHSDNICWMSRHEMISEAIRVNVESNSPHIEHLHIKHLHIEHLHIKYLHIKHLHIEHLHIEHLHIEHLHIEHLHIDQIVQRPKRAPQQNELSSLSRGRQKNGYTQIVSPQKPIPVIFIIIIFWSLIVIYNDWLLYYLILLSSIQLFHHFHLVKENLGVFIFLSTACMSRGWKKKWHIKILSLSWQSLII